MRKPIEEATKESLTQNPRERNVEEFDIKCLRRTLGVGDGDLITNRDVGNVGNARGISGHIERYIKEDSQKYRKWGILLGRELSEGRECYLLERRRYRMV